MNNRKTTNKREKSPRQQWAQFVPEPTKIRFYVGKGEEKQLIEMDNPRAGRIRRIIHNIKK